MMRDHFDLLEAELDAQLLARERLNGLIVLKLPRAARGRG